MQRSSNVVTLAEEIFTTAIAHARIKDLNKPQSLSIKSSCAITRISCWNIVFESIQNTILEMIKEAKKCIYFEDLNIT